MVELEKQASEMHDRWLRPLAERLALDVTRWPARTGGTPMILFLGNHSSGKSTFINHLLGQAVQATGLAPTDDGFTLLTWGLQEGLTDGPTATSHPHFDLSDLAHFGPAFTAKLRLRTVRHELLREVTLVDSPGMIDAVGKANTRGYDFPGAVRWFSERADLILFFFDPDKPGTTAESVAVLTQTLAGLGHKLMLVLNKVDRFESVRDLARTYGTLCWNLAKVIPTKDIPHIAMCQVPAGSPGVSSVDRPPPTGFSGDFEASRQEILEAIRKMPSRRMDNLVTDLLQRTRELWLHARVCRQVGREYRRLRLQWLGACLGTAVLAGVAIWLAWPAPQWTTRLWVILISVIAVAAAWGLGHWQAHRFTRRRLHASVLDDAFESACEGELTLRERTDLRALWEGLRERTARAVRHLGPGKLATSFGLGRQIQRLDQAVTKDIPALRRDLGGRQPELPLEPV
jgi:hypothetical protein